MGWRFFSRLLGLINTLVLVRLLAPSDFGLVALATSFAFAVDGLSYLGVQEALVRERALDRALYDTGFTMNAVRGLLTALVIAACAWPGARFFGDMRLVAIFLVLAVGLFMSSLENIGAVDFQRDLFFGKQVQIMLVPRIASMVATIIVAVVWHSYWALVIGVLVGRSSRLISTYVVHPYRPRVTLSAWRRLVGFSFWSWMLSMVSLLQSRCDAIVIGGYLNPTAVGLYSVGIEVGGLASTELLDPILRALFAGFSAVRRSGGDIAASYLQAISVAAIVILPASAGIALVARPLVHLIFGPLWDAAIPLVQAFACIGVMRVGAYISSTLLFAEGAPQVTVRIEVPLMILRVLSLVVLVPIFGLFGAVWSVAVTGVIEEITYLIVTFRRTGLRGRDLADNLWRPLLATGGMAVVLYAAGLTNLPSGASTAWSAGLLGGSILLGVVTFATLLGLSWLISGRPRGGEADALAFLRGTFRRRMRA